jgi:hypothetical protein
MQCRVISGVRVRKTHPKKVRGDDKGVSCYPAVVHRRSSVAMLEAHRHPVSKELRKRHYESHRSCKSEYLKLKASPILAVFIRITCHKCLSNRENNTAKLRFRHPHTKSYLAVEGVVKHSVVVDNIRLLRCRRCGSSGWGPLAVFRKIIGTHTGKPSDALIVILSYAVHQ